MNEPMHEATDYFENHRHKLRFPWSLYHRPITQAFEAALGRSPGPDVLNVGAGPFFELSRVDIRGRRLTVCDIDARAVELARELHGEKLAGADVLEPGAPLPYADASFDLVVAMEVIEHLAEPLPWLRELVRVLRPGGELLLTTPNYASASLVAIENTALELVARSHGFTRKTIHPTKFAAQSLSALMAEAGATRIEVGMCSFGWVLVGRGKKR
jgi:SAM-dependent methyltransferase